jgi:predicted DNA-binding protein (UPF0251 family)
MAGIPAVFTLIPESIEEEIVAESAEHELVELTLHELVAIHLVNFTLALTNSALSTQTSQRTIQRPLADVFLDFLEIHQHFSSGW